MFNTLRKQQRLIHAIALNYNSPGYSLRKKVAAFGIFLDNFDIRTGFNKRLCKVERNLAAAEKDNILTSADCNTDTLKEFCGNFGLCNNRNSVTAVNNKITVRNEHLIPSLNRTDSHLTSEVVNSAQSSSDN